MRYREAYELVNAALIKNVLGYPVTDSLISNFFDAEVGKLGRTCVRKKASVVLVSSGVREYTLTPDDITPAVYKVELGETLVPFVPEASINSNIKDTDVSNIGFFLKTHNINGSITGISKADPAVVTSTAHGLSTDDRVKISEVSGFLESGDEYGTLSTVNGLNHSITKVTDDTFSVPLDSSAYNVAYTSGGVWTHTPYKLHFTKAPDSGDITVYYYASPRPRNSQNSEVDLPDILVTSAIHYVISKLLDLDGQLQVGSGHRGIGRSHEEEYKRSHTAREVMPDIIPPPMADWINHQ
jgi:hypothetical protein